jgi:hypothetical protein
MGCSKTSSVSLVLSLMSRRTQWCVAQQKMSPKTLSMLRSLLSDQKLRMVVTVSNLLRNARSWRSRRTEYSRKAVAADDGLQQTEPRSDTKCCIRSSSETKHWLPAVWWNRQYVSWCWEKIRSKGGGFRSEAVKSGGQRHKRVGEREIGTKWNFTINLVGATIFGWPYKPGIYTPRLGHQPFRHITNMAPPVMDSVNTAIGCLYSTVHPFNIMKTWG